MRVGALDLDHLSLEILTTSRPTLPPDHQLAIDALEREAAKLGEIDADQSAMDALGAAARRLILALGHIRRLEKALSDDKAAETAIGGVSLAAFLPKRSYSLAALGPHFTLASPVLRYSVRLALAMMAGAVIAQFLGDSGHGNWVLLTISVIMRANYGLTRRRRDERVIGTLIGCVLAAGAVAWLPAGVLVAVQGLSLAVTHSFVRLNYALASVGASVTALVSLHLVQPALPAPILARLADTLLGAAIAHLFSYVWPHWEFSEAPGIASRLLARLAAFADVCAEARRRPAGIPARAKEHDRGAGRALGLGRADEHRADRDPQGTGRNGGAADRCARSRRSAFGGPARRAERRSRGGRSHAGLASGAAWAGARRGRRERASAAGAAWPPLRKAWSRRPVAISAPPRQRWRRVSAASRLTPPPSSAHSRSSQKHQI